MVKDILLDIKEQDVLLADTASNNEPCFDVRWSGNVCNIIIPAIYTNYVFYDANGEFTCKVKISYKPLASAFSFAIQLVNGTSPVSGGNAASYIYGSLEKTLLKASQLPIINTDGTYRLLFKRSSESVLVYSGEESDFAIGPSDNQNAQLITLCGPGKNYRYPTTGIDITKYLNSVVAQTDLQEQIQNQFNADNKTIYSAEFDSQTGDLETFFSAEKEQDDDTSTLTPIAELDTSVIDNMTDDEIRNLIDFSYYEYQED